MTGETIYPCTIESKNYINNHFGVELPNDLYDFSCICNTGIGTCYPLFNEDYKNSDHIIRLNSYFKNYRRKKHKDKWSKIFNNEFITITDGHDGVYVCLNSEDLKMGNDKIYYLDTSGRIEFISDNFISYIKSYCTDFISSIAQQGDAPETGSSE